MKGGNLGKGAAAGKGTGKANWGKNAWAQGESPAGWPCEVAGCGLCNSGKLNWLEGGLHGVQDATRNSTAASASAITTTAAAAAAAAEGPAEGATADPWGSAKTDEESEARRNKEAGEGGGRPASERKLGAGGRAREGQAREGSPAEAAEGAQRLQSQMAGRPPNGGQAATSMEVSAE